MCWAGSGDLSFATSTFLILHFIPAHTELAHVAERHRRAGGCLGFIWSPRVCAQFQTKT